MRRLLAPLLLLAAALALRVDWHLAFQQLPLYLSPAVDEALHWDWAQALAAGRGSPEIPYFRAPLYPWWLGFLHRAGLGIAGLRWAGTALGVASLLLLTWLAGRWLGRSAGLAALALAGGCAAWIYYEPQLLLEHGVLFLLLAATTAWLLAGERPPGPCDLAFGLALGLAAITRPNALVLALLALLLIWRMRESRSRRGLRLLWWLGGWLPPLALVAAINGWPGSGVLVASQGGVNLWIGNNPAANGWSAVLPGAGHAWERADAAGWATREAGRPLTAGEESRFYARRAVDWWRTHPGEAARLWGRKIVLLLAPEELGNNTSPAVLAARRPWMAALLPISWWLLLLPGLAGLALGFPRHAALRAWVLGALLLYAASFIPFFITGRFRLPLLPLLALPAADLAAYALPRVWRTVARHLVGRPVPEPAPSRLPLRPARLLLLGLLLAAPVLAWRQVHEEVAGEGGRRGWQSFQLGNAWMRLQQPDSARACFLDALEDAPALPEVRLNLGLLAWRVDPARAESLFRAELAWNPTCAKAWNNLGGLWLEQGEPARAAEAFRLALRLRPDLADAAWNLGLAQTRLGLAALAAGDSASARAVLQEVLSSPYRGAGQRRLATVLTSAGKPATP